MMAGQAHTRRADRWWDTQAGQVPLAARRWRGPIIVLALILVIGTGFGIVAHWQPWRPAPLVGLAFTPFRDCQSPERGEYPDAAQMHEDVDLIRGLGNGLRTYTSRHGQDEAAEYASRIGLRVTAGAWLGRDDTAEQRAANEAEIDAVIGLAQRVRLDAVVVGNEVGLRNDVTPARLVEYVLRVKQAVDVPVATADTVATFTRPDYTAVVDAIDFVMVHVHPYWDQVDVAQAAEHVARAYRATAAATGKRVVIGETGWPSAGQRRGAAIPSLAAAEQFRSDWSRLAARERIDYVYFSMADENWKRAEPGEVGPHWGVLDASRQPKFPLRSKPAPTPAPTGSPPSIQDSNALLLYQSWPDRSTFAPTGHYGDQADLAFNDCASGGRGSADPARTDYAIRTEYHPSDSGQGWAGLSLMDGSGRPDLREYARLTFAARGATGGERVSFFAGTRPAPPAVDPKMAGRLDVELGPDWATYTIDLTGLDLSAVTDGFGWSLARAGNPTGATVLLDDIRFEPDRKPCIDPVPGAPADARYILDGRTLCSTGTAGLDYGLGVDTSGRYQDWLRPRGEALRMEYPGGQQWGAVFLTVGQPVPPGSRPGTDLSKCQALEVELRSDSPGASLGIGMKDSTMADNGAETKIRVRPIQDWHNESFALTAFAPVHLAQVYVIIEFVFEAYDPAQAVEFRNVRLRCG